MSALGEEVREASQQLQQATTSEDRLSQVETQNNQLEKKIEGLKEELQSKDRSLAELHAQITDLQVRAGRGLGACAHPMLAIS